MRCGKKTEGKDVFCAECLVEMEQYPVKPGTMVQLPTHTEPEHKKPLRKKKELTPEEQLEKARNLIQYLIICILVLVSTLIITGMVLLYTMTQVQTPPEETPPPQGRNYTITTPTEG